MTTSASEQTTQAPSPVRLLPSTIRLCRSATSCRPKTCLAPSRESCQQPWTKHASCDATLRNAPRTKLRFCPSAKRVPERCGRLSRTAPRARPSQPKNSRQRCGTVCACRIERNPLFAPYATTRWTNLAITAAIALRAVTVPSGIMACGRSFSTYAAKPAYDPKLKIWLAPACQTIQHHVPTQARGHIPSMLDWRFACCTRLCRDGAAATGHHRRSSPHAFVRRQSVLAI